MSNVMTNRFEDFLLEKNDCIDNAAYDLVCALASHGCLLYTSDAADEL